MDGINITQESSYLTPFVFSPLFPALLMSLATQKQAPITKNTFRDTYDYIVVGAGSAGSVVASRLSEMGCVSVLLLEAGKGAPVVSDVPAVSRSFVGSDLDWQYKTTPQAFTAAALVNREVVWPSGKAIGGSSVINAMLYVRGNRKNYDDWAKSGATGWSFQDVLPYFKKLEDYQDLEFVGNGFHGTGGPVTVMNPNYDSEIRDPLTEAADELGYKFVDSNGPSQTGFYDVRGTLRNGQRCSAAKAYLVPAENRTNLHIISGAMVRKVLISNTRPSRFALPSPRAYGVQFDFEGTTYEVKARNEVIMSAGTTNTAQLLMLSGIGPKSELMRFNIPIIADLPVGLNLQDHLGAFTAFTIDDTIPKFLEKLADDTNIGTYIANRSGPLGSPEAVSMLSFLGDRVLVPKIPSTETANADLPNYQLYFLEGLPELLVAQIGMKPEAFNQYYGPYANSTFYWCVSSILHPRSKGYVSIGSTNPYDPPVINPNYFASPADRDDIVQGMKTCNRIARTRAMNSIGTRPFETLFPGCESLVAVEEAYLDCQAKSLVLTFNHQTGTAKMGNPLDPSTVVDPNLRVKGVTGLRVVDASVMPTVPWGNTNIPTMMVAEKASDIIKRGIKCDSARGY